MCGKETSGIEVADPTLYQGRTFILSPLSRTSPEALALGHEIARAAGSKPLVVDGATIYRTPLAIRAVDLATGDLRP